MSNQKIISIDGGSPQYWQQRKAAFALIRDAEWAAQVLANAALYLHGGYDADGDVIAVENLGPHDDMEDALRAIAANETALRILAAQERTEIDGHVIRALTQPTYSETSISEDPESNPWWGPDTD